MFFAADLPPAPAYEMVLQSAPGVPSELLASTAAHLKTIKQCPAHEHFVKGVCTPYIEWMSPMPPMASAKKTG